MNSRFDEVRHEQASEGARMAREDDHHPMSRPPRTLHRPKKPNAPKGHEAFLKALETSGAEVEVEKMSTGDLLRGTIKHSDKYTITLRQVNGDEVVNRVLFKHDISEFRALTSRPDAVETTEGTPA